MSYAALVQKIKTNHVPCAKLVIPLMTLFRIHVNAMPFT